MDYLFGLSMDHLMVSTFLIFLAIMLVVGFFAIKNRVMVRLGLRNIPRRRSQTVLIIIGSMLSAMLIASAFTVGDTLDFSIKSEGIKFLGNIDEVLTSTDESDSFGVDTPAYMPSSRFEKLKHTLSEFREIDGLVPYIGETVAIFNPRTSLSDGNTRLTGIDENYLDGFGDFISVNGDKVSIGELPDKSLFINSVTAQELDAEPGDSVRLFLGQRELDYRVEAVVLAGGLSGIESTVIMPLSRAQNILGRPNEINFIAVSNLGDARQGAELSEIVTKELRTQLADPQAVRDLLVILSQENITLILREHVTNLSGKTATDLEYILNGLHNPGNAHGLIAALSDEEVGREIIFSLKQAGLADVEAEVDDLLVNELAEIRVFEIKKFMLDIATVAASGATTFFIIIGLFSVMVGMLLIFLIFVMLAAARRTEMGMIRAIGGKRRHLVQMFVFEGIAYNLVASAVGTVLGLLVSLFLVAAFNYMLSSIVSSFPFTYHVELRSVVIAFCSGMIIVFITASVSAYRVSRMNIAEAVRGLPEILIVKKEDPIQRRLMDIIGVFVKPISLGFHAITMVPQLNLFGFLNGFAGMLLWMPVSPLWWGALCLSVGRFSWPYFRRGWLTCLVGILLVYVGAVVFKQTGPFALGISLLIIGTGLLLRLIVTRRPGSVWAFGLLTVTAGVFLLLHGLSRQNLVPILTGIGDIGVGFFMMALIRSRGLHEGASLVGRLTSTFIGIIMLSFWVLPTDTIDPITGDLKDNAEMFFVSGIAMVAAAVWTVMYNADLMLKALVSVTSRLGKMRPVLVTAVAYPMNAKFRTGLTLAMFSLVIFTLMVMSLVNNAFKNVFSDTDRITGQWDISATVSPNSPIDDVFFGIETSPAISLSDFEAIGGYVEGAVKVRQAGIGSKIWESYKVVAGDDDFLTNSRYNFKIFSAGYSTNDQIWTALAANPELAVIDVSAISGDDGGFRGPAGSLKIEGVKLDDEQMTPFFIEVEEPRSGRQFQYKIIGVLDSAADLNGIVASKSSIDEALPFPIPLTTYRFRTDENSDVAKISKGLESTFVQNGMESTVLEEDLANTVSFITSFYNLITGYMGLGLVVGIAALGVVSMRAVVERRQQIGVLRAIGYRRRMVQLSFLIESSFVALLGIAIGIALGTVISYNVVNEIGNELDGIKFSVPWTQIFIIVGIAYFFSLLTTFLPARQASNILPAEALRYE
ncbi:FtsX-like permease family protein [SAR202 cluster bacterium AD-804-J14_MRT_500m]|nr:FtsX-like permease family protein [SAR202 cluster bacterium AD-804-J14_MRT_500m]